MILYITCILSVLLPITLQTDITPDKNDTVFGIRASREDIKTPEDLKIPLPLKDRKIPTLNKTGYMTQDQCTITHKFIEFAAKSTKPALDIGAAYGITTLPALEQGATVIANDIDQRHLVLLRSQTPVNMRSRLFLNDKRFPEETNFPDNSLDAILISSVAHFLREDEMETALKKTYSWLDLGGRVYFVTMSPYHYLLTDFLPTYKARLDNKIKWAGSITDMHAYNPAQKDQIPSYLHVMDKETLGIALKENGFTILEESFFDYENTNKELATGLGRYGVIAEKPNN